MMRTTRRNFLTMAAAAVASLVIPKVARAEADDSAPLDTWHPKTMRRTSWADGAMMTDKIDDWEIEHGNLVMFPDAKTELLIDGEWRIVVEPGTTIVGVDSAARPSFSYPEQELYLSDVRQAFVRGSRLIADNIGATLPPLRATETDQDVGRALVQVFDNYASENGIDPCVADSIREDIRDAWGISDSIGIEIQWFEHGPDLDDLMVQALLNAGYTPLPNHAPEYVTPQWLVEELRKRA